MGCVSVYASPDSPVSVDGEVDLVTVMVIVTTLDYPASFVALTVKV